MALRQKYTESAVLYEKTLRPFLKRMNDGKGILKPCNVLKIIKLASSPILCSLSLFNLNVLLTTFLKEGFVKCCVVKGVLKGFWFAILSDMKTLCCRVLVQITEGQLNDP